MTNARGTAIVCCISCAAINIMNHEPKLTAPRNMLAVVQVLLMATLVAVSCCRSVVRDAFL